MMAIKHVTASKAMNLMGLDIFPPEWESSI
jgi:hypothetical protein